MKSDYMPFANETASNVVSQPDWEADPDRPHGFNSGVAASNRFNKVWRQCSVMSAAIGQFIADHSSQNVVDDGNVAALKALFQDAVVAVGGGGGTGSGVPEAPTDGKMYGRQSAAWHVSVEEAPTDGKAYARAGLSGTWQAAPREAPADGVIYGRNGQTSTWVAVLTQALADARYAPISVPPEAPTDAQIYGRRGSDHTWQPVLTSAIADSTYAKINSPAFTGAPTAPNPINSESSTRLATTFFVQNLIAGLATGVTSVTAGAGLTGGGTGAVTLSIAAGGVTNGLIAAMSNNTVKGNVSGAAASPSDLTSAQLATLLGLGPLATQALPATVAQGGTGSTTAAGALNNLGAAPITSPNFLGTPTAVTAAPLTNTTQLATCAFVQSAVSAATTGVSSVTAGTGLTGGGTGAVSIALTTPVAVANGGTGSGVAATALANLGGLALAGGTMTGALTLSGAPTVNLHAATKLYVDTAPNQTITVSGDASGTGTAALALTVTGLQGRPMVATAPTGGQALIWNGTNSQWTPTTVSAAAGGTTGQVQFNNAGALGGFTVGGDATLATATGVMTLATVNSNIGSFQGLTINAKGLVTAASNMNYLTGNQSISLTGDVTGTGPVNITTTVVQLQGRPMSATAPTTNQVLQYSGTQWQPATLGTGGTVTSIAVGTGLTGTPTTITTTGTIALTSPVSATIGGTGQTTWAQGDLLYASAANTLSRLTKDANATRYLSNTGATNNPAWAQVNLANGVTGTLPIANGGTNLTTYAQGDLVYASAANTLARLAKDANATRYLSNTGATNNPAWAQINLANGVTGTLPIGSGGTNATALPLSAGVGNYGLTTTLLGSSGAVVAPIGGAAGTVGTWGGGQLALQHFGEAGIELSRINGTLASPTAILAGDYVASFWFNGWVSNTWPALGAPGQISMVATENWSTSVRGSRFDFRVTPTGSNTPQTVFQIAGAQTVFNYSGAALPPDPDGQIRPLRIATPSSGNTYCNVLTDSWNDGGGIDSRRANGTPSAPTALLSGATGGGIFTIGIHGYGTSQYLTWVSWISIQASENWTNTAAGTSFTLCLCPNGTNAGVSALEVYGGGNMQIFGNTATKVGGGSWAAPSDTRLKHDVADYTRGLDAVCRLRPVTYRHNGRGGFRDDGTVYHGLMASEVEGVMPEMVGRMMVNLDNNERKFTESGRPYFDPPDTEVRTIDSTALLYALVNAVKELSGQVQELRNPGESGNGA